MTLLDLIGEIPDPRMFGKVKHNLGTIIFTTLCGVLCGCESWEEIEDYCESKQDWLSNYVDLSSGIPSHWTFRRVFTRLEPNFLETLLRSHVQGAASKETDQIAVDGKALRGSRGKGFRCLHSVSAWCHENNLILGEESVQEKSNEKTAMPLLLKSLDLKGATVSIDAGGCTKEIAQMIQEKKGDYVLALKRNQKKLYQSVVAGLERVENKGLCLEDHFDESHGRSVRRRYFCHDLSTVDLGWGGLKSVVSVETISSQKGDTSGKVSSQWRYYLSTHPFGHEKLPGYIRNHWSIENKLHWVLDVHIREDDDQKMDRKSVRCLALLKRIALNILRSKPEITTKKKKVSLKRRMKKSLMKDAYLEQILLG